MDLVITRGLHDRGLGQYRDNNSKSTAHPGANLNSPKIENLRFRFFCIQQFTQARGWSATILQTRLGANFSAAGLIVILLLVLRASLRTKIRQWFCWRNKGDMTKGLGHQVGHIREVWARCWDHNLQSTVSPGVNSNLPNIKFMSVSSLMTSQVLGHVSLSSKLGPLLFCPFPQECVCADFNLVMWVRACVGVLRWCVCEGIEVVLCPPHLCHVPPRGVGRKRRQKV